VDAGNVFEQAAGAALGDLVTSYGAGLRLATPFALIRVDYGRPFSASPGESRGGRWTFGIGHAF
jgi:outer membrane protein assembly factor BamA